MEASVQMKTESSNGCTFEMQPSCGGQKITKIVEEVDGAMSDISENSQSVRGGCNSDLVSADKLNGPGSPRNYTSSSSYSRNLRDRSKRQIYPMKIRQRRSQMQKMTRPLKRWLCDHRTNPYPTRVDKELLARDSQMSLVQVSNWFANARRRLKSTVKGEHLTWSSRVKMYNGSVTGNAELLSISSDDSFFESDVEDDGPQRNNIEEQEVTSQPVEQEKEEEVVPSRSQTPTLQTDEHFFFPQIKPTHEFGSQNKYYKHTLLKRYLNDTCSHTGQRIENLDVTTAAFNKTRSRRPSGSIGSRDYEEMSTSSGVSLSNDSYLYYPPVFEDMYSPTDDLEAAARRRRISGDVRGREAELHWQELEISAAMALTSLARSRRHNVT